MVHSPLELPLGPHRGTQFRHSRVLYTLSSNFGNSLSHVPCAIAPLWMLNKLQS